MSFQYILPVVEEWLQQRPILDTGMVGVLPEGRPLPTARSFCVAIDEAGKTPDGPAHQADHARRIHSLEITLNWRLGQIPSDRHRSIYTSNVTGLEALEEAVFDALHNSHNLRQAINQNAAGKVEFLTPLFYQGTSRTRMAGPEWDGGVGEPAARAWAVRAMLFSGLLLVRPRQFGVEPA